MRRKIRTTISIIDDILVWVILLSLFLIPVGPLLISFISQKYSIIFLWVDITIFILSLFYMKKRILEMEKMSKK